MNMWAKNHMIIFQKETSIWGRRQKLTESQNKLEQACKVCRGVPYSICNYIPLSTALCKRVQPGVSRQSGSAPYSSSVVAMLVSLRWRARSIGSSPLESTLFRLTDNCNQINQLSNLESCLISSKKAHMFTVDDVYVRHLLQTQDMTSKCRRYAGQSLCCN